MESKGKNRTLNDFSVLKIKKFREWMLSRRYSGNTITTYTDALMSFLKFHSNKSILEITNDDVIKFNNEFVTDLRYILELIIFNKRNKPLHIYQKTGRLERVCIGYKRVMGKFNKHSGSRQADHLN